MCKYYIKKRSMHPGMYIRYINMSPIIIYKPHSKRPPNCVNKGLRIINKVLQSIVSLKEQ